MTSMLAAVVVPEVTGRLDLREVERPIAGPGEVLVRVRAVSLNRGEVGAAQRAPEGTRIGWDLAGVVEDAGSEALPLGTRVVGFSAAKRGWAEVVAVPEADLAPVPEGVDDGDAAALPVAALTALYALERGRRLLGARVLVTGATGGVGLFAVQLAALMGARVVAQVRRPEQTSIVEAAGAAEVIVSDDGSGIAEAGPYGHVVDGIGGPVLSAALRSLTTGSSAVLFGVTASPKAELAVGPMLGSGNARVEGFNLYHERTVAPARQGLRRLLPLVASGRLSPMIEARGSWTDIGRFADDLLQRRIHGKAVLRVGDGH